VRAFTDLASRAQVRIRTDHRRFVDTGAINHASGPDQNAVADLRIADYAIGTNPAVTSDMRRAQNLNERFNGRVRTDFDIAIDYAGLRVKNSDACSHKPLALCSADALINIHQFFGRPVDLTIGRQTFRLGSGLLLLRLSDAVAELGPTLGRQVHRSYWVARRAVSSVERDRYRVRLILRNGARVPVSRTFLPKLRAEGWL